MNRPKSIFRLVLIVFAILVLAGAIVGYQMFNLKHKDLKSIRPDLAISAIDLQKAFESDETSATQKYVNKVIELTGRIISVKNGENNTLSVSLQTGNDLSSVICTFEGNPDPALFVAGNEITVRGECSGYLMDVLLNNCSVIRQNK